MAAEAQQHVTARELASLVGGVSAAQMGLSIHGGDVLIAGSHNVAAGLGNAGDADTRALSGSTVADERFAYQ